MHPITLPITELKSALAGLGKVINQRATLPVLHHLKIERTTDGWITLTGTDLDRFVTMRLEQPAEGPPVALLVPYDQLQQLTKNCEKDERMLIDPGPDGALIRFALAENLGASKVKLLPLKEFPDVPRIKTEFIPLPSEFRRSIHEALDCASKDETRYVINGAFIDASTPKANYVVGTNGKILYSANSFNLPLKNSIILPTHKFLAWKEFNNDGEWQMRADKEHVQVSTRRWRFITKQIEGQYPNWRQVIPEAKTFKTYLTIDPAQVEPLIKLFQRLPCHDEKFRCLGLEWKAGQFLLLAKETSNDPWLRIPVANSKGEGPEVTIFLDRRYMLQALEFGLNTISIIDSISPLRFHNQGKQMIVMPVRSEADNGQKPVPANEPAPQPIQPPAAPPRPEPPTQEERKPAMITTSAPEEPPPNSPKNPIEEAIDLTLKARDTFQAGIDQLRDLHGKLKAINRDNRSSSKELNSLRTRLRSLKDLTF